MSKCLVQRAIAFFTLVILLTCSACGGGGLAKFRVLHAAPDEPQLNVLVNGNIVSSNLAYTDATGYINVNSGARTFELVPVNSDTPLINTTLNLAASTSSTVIVTGIYPINTIILVDGAQTPSSGTALIRLVNAAPSMGSADVYVVPQGSGLTGATPLAAGLGFQVTSTYETLNVATGSTGNYQVYFTEPGSTLVLATGPLSVSSGEALTIVSLNGVNGGFTFQSLIDLK